MAKEIYIDNLGNEIPVCGVPLSASDLPIQAGSPTSTADAIDGIEAQIQTFNLVDLGTISNETLTLTFATTTHMILITTGGSTARMGMYICRGTTTTCLFNSVLTSSQVTLANPQDSKLTITASATNVKIYAVNLNAGDFTFT